MKDTFKYLLLLSAVATTPLLCKLQENTPQIDTTEVDALFQAAEKGNLTTLQEYIQNGGNVNIAYPTDKHCCDEDSSEHQDVCYTKGDTLLHIATLCSHVKLVKFLLENNACPSCQNEQRETPLHYAAEGCHKEDEQLNSVQEIITLLIKHDAQVNAEDEDGWTALDVAANRCCGQTPYYSVGVCATLLKNGANVQGGSDLWTPLHSAASGEGNYALAQLLISLNADVNAQDDRGITPLHMALGAHKNLEIGALLLEHGADKTLKNNDGKTAFEWDEDNKVELTQLYSLLSLSYCIKWSLYSELVKRKSF